MAAPSSQALQDIHVAILVTDGFEEAELTEPARALGQAGAKVAVIAPHTGKLRAFRHMTPSIEIPVDMTLNQARPEQFDAVLLPGGALNADQMRVEPQVKSFLQTMQQAGKPFAIICHAPWELVSAGLAHGRTLTSYYTIQDDMRNAGANWIDQEVVVDGNLVTSRQPTDIPAFNREMICLFATAKRAQLGAMPSQSDVDQRPGA